MPAVERALTDAERGCSLVFVEIVGQELFGGRHVSPLGESLATRCDSGANRAGDLFPGFRRFAFTAHCCGDSCIEGPVIAIELLFLLAVESDQVPAAQQILVECRHEFLKPSRRGAVVNTACPCWA